MNNNSYSILKKLEGYKVGAEVELEQELKSLGLIEKQFEGGGGPEEAIQQIVANLSIHDFWVGVISSLAANRIEKILSRLFQWNRKNTTKNNKVQPIVNIYIYSPVKNSKMYTFSIDKKYSKKEILEILRKK